MKYTVDSIAQMLGLSLGHIPGIDNTIDTLLIDSRDIAQGDGVLFFAIRTPGNDGHRYISELYDKGVRCFVVEYIPQSMQNVPDAVFLQVSSTTKALHTIAATHRNRFDIPVIAVTGSNGKTATKEWLHSLLHNDHVIVRSPRSYNSALGVPLSVWGIEPRHTLGIFEAGISKTGEMQPLHDILRPTIGILTCIGPEHDEGFESRRQKCMEKCRLFKGCEYIVYKADDALIDECVRASCPDSRLIGWSYTNPDAHLYIKALVPQGRGTRMEYRHDGEDHTLFVPFKGPEDIRNAVHCLATLLILGIPDEHAATRMTTLRPVDTRLDVIEGVNGCILFNDHFTPDVESLRIALDFMGRHTTQGRTTTAILTIAYNDPKTRPLTHRRVAETLAKKGVTRFIGIGAEWRPNAHHFPPNSLFFDTVDQMLEAMSPADFNSELVLLKDSVRHPLDPVRQMLEARHHETTLQVNIDSLLFNFNHFRAQLPPGTGIVAMVKANAYGTGSLEIAKTLQTQGAAYLAVAVLDEGVALRKAGITMPIMVLNPRVTNYRALFAYRLEPEIYSFEMLEQVAREAKKGDIREYPIHIKLDTGMHRLGFMPDEIPALIKALAHMPQLKVKSVFSHLATADCLEEDEYTLRQLDTFDSCVKALREGLPHADFLTHILNTAGIMRFGKERHYDMARPGIGLYGISPIEGMGEKLRPIASITTVITNLRDYQPGDTIGYSRRGVITRLTRIATLTIGYADGLDRRLGNGRASFLVNGKMCPTVGNICMDACMLDVTGVDCHINDTVEIFGPGAPIQQLAQAEDTIPYEVLTSVSPRVKRVYYRE